MSSATEDQDEVVLTTIPQSEEKPISAVQSLLAYLVEIMPALSNAELAELYEGCHAAFPTFGPILTPLKMTFATIATQQAASPACKRTHENISRTGSAHTAPRSSKWNSFNASDIKAMLPSASPKIDLPDLKVVHLSGFRLIPGKSITVVKDMLDTEFQFNPANIWNLSNRGHSIIELVVVKDSVPDLILALKNNKFGLKLSETYDPRRPDGLESSEDSLHKFRNRISRDIARIHRECEKVMRYSLTLKLKTLARFLEAFRDGDISDPVVPDVPVPYYVSAFNTNAVVNDTSVRNLIC